MENMGRWAGGSLEVAADDRDLDGTVTSKSLQSGGAKNVDVDFVEIELPCGRERDFQGFGGSDGFHYLRQPRLRAALTKASSMVSAPQPLSGGDLEELLGLLA